MKASPEWPQWHEAILLELATLEDMGTWRLEDLPEHQEPLTIQHHTRLSEL